MSAVADVLNGAADLIERDGWVQGAYKQGSRRCARQALGDAANLSFPSAQWAAYHAAGDTLAEGLEEQSVWAWNDAPGRTQAEVVAALQIAAERAA